MADGKGGAKAMLERHCRCNAGAKEVLERYGRRGGLEKKLA